MIKGNSIALRMLPHRASRPIAAVFFAFHVCAISVGALTFSAPLPALVAPFVTPYLAITGSQQGWAMYTSAPTLQDLQISLIATAPDGTSRSLDPILPDFTAYRGDVRNFAFFTAALYSAPEVLELYFSRACQALAARGIAATSLTLGGRESFTLPLGEIRATGRMAEVRPLTRGPFTCPR